MLSPLYQSLEKYGHFHPPLVLFPPHQSGEFFPFLCEHVLELSDPRTLRHLVPVRLLKRSDGLCCLHCGNRSRNTVIFTLRWSYFLSASTASIWGIFPVPL